MAQTREKKRAQQMARYTANKEKLLAQQRERRAANPEKVLERHKARREANREKLREKERARRAKNPEKVLAAVKAWKAANPKRYREIQIAAAHRRRARKKGAAGNIKTSEIEALRAKAGQRCHNCQITERQHMRKYGFKLTIDHINPLAKEGAHTISNVQFLCFGCNSSKGARDPIAWAQANGRLV